ncbi:uncharacterized protein LOC130656685 [Hydractinia symbiolongicarpus]|uniref:uncharacterized protein LOC130656685 n=1 Tax=Hydractinia symbiolongicarpus TaxID=13093 RepID=UPI002551761A|nr:uncharacterized protein LOC130656685 [Hydractinia symbiolongicarpus]
MKSLVALITVLAGIVYSSPLLRLTSDPTASPQPVGPCNALDQCAIFGGFNVGNFRLSSDPHVFVTCTGTEIITCQRCPAQLFFSNKCNACMEEEDDSLNVCTTTQPVNPVTTPSYNMNWCKEPPRNGNHVGNLADPDNEHFYFACVYDVTYHMPCGAGLVYNQTCNACLSPGSHI